MLKKILIMILAVCIVLILAACPEDNDDHDEDGSAGNPCDEICEMHSADGDCHCHGLCGTEGCLCHGAH